MQLNNNCTMYLREISNVLAIACIFRKENLINQGLVDHNINCLKRKIEAIFKLRDQYKDGAAGGGAGAAEGAVGGAAASSVGAAANSYRRV